MKVLRGIALAAALSVFTTSAPSRAQGDKEAARALADKAYELYRAGKYAEAIDGFKKADAKYHAPTITLMEAQALEKAGRLREARDVYKRVAAEPVEKGSPAEFKAAVTTAEKASETIGKRVPSLVIVIRGSTPHDVALKIDGTSLPLPQPGKSIEIDPGTHAIEGTSNGDVVTAKVTIAEGRTERVELVFAPHTPAGPPPDPLSTSSSDAPPAPPPAQVLDDAPVPEGEPSPAPVIAAFAVGGAGIAVGAITGIASLVKVGDLKSRCLSGVCPSRDQPDANTARGLATASTVAFIVGAAGAAAGVVLVVVRSKKSAPRSAITMSPGVLSLEGSF